MRRYPNLTFARKFLQHDSDEAARTRWLCSSGYKRARVSLHTTIFVVIALALLCIVPREKLSPFPSLRANSLDLITVCLLPSRPERTVGLWSISVFKVSSSIMHSSVIFHGNFHFPHKTSKQPVYNTTSDFSHSRFWN